MSVTKELLDKFTKYILRDEIGNPKEFEIFYGENMKKINNLYKDDFWGDMPAGLIIFGLYYGMVISDDFYMEKDVEDKFIDAINNSRVDDFIYEYYKNRPTGYYKDYMKYKLFIQKDPNPRKK